MEIPNSVYAIIGFVVVMNLSTLGALIVFIFKVGQFVSDTKHGIKNSGETAVRAHKRIDNLEKVRP